MDTSPAKVTSVRLQDSTLKRVKKRGLPLREIIEAHAWAEESVHEEVLDTLLANQEKGSPLWEKGEDEEVRCDKHEDERIGTTPTVCKVRALPKCIRGRS